MAPSLRGAPAPLSFPSPAKAPRARSEPPGAIAEGAEEPRCPGRALRDSPGARPPAGRGATAHESLARPCGQFLVPCTAQPANAGLCTVGLGLSCGSAAKGPQGSGHSRGRKATSPGLFQASSSLPRCCWGAGDGSLGPRRGVSGPFVMWDMVVARDPCDIREPGPG